MDTKIKRIPVIQTDGVHSGLALLQSGSEDGRLLIAPVDLSQLKWQRPHELLSELVEQSQDAQG